MFFVCSGISVLLFDTHFRDHHASQYVVSVVSNLYCQIYQLKVTQITRMDEHRTKNKKNRPYV